LRGVVELGSIAGMRRSNATAAVLVAVVVVVGVLALRFRPVLPPDQHAAAAVTQATPEPAYPPASIDGRLPESPSRTVELCGYGPFEITPERMHPPHLVAAADLALAQAVAAMADADVPHQRAAARYLQMTEASLRTYAGHLAQQPGCEEDLECRSQARDASLRAFALARESLVADALDTRDPAAHALAYYACVRSPRDAEDAAVGSCGRISAAQWAQVEPDNLIAWLHVAHEAQSRGDTTGHAEALNHAAHATASRVHVDTVLAPLGHPAVRGLDAVTRSIAQLHAMGIRAAIPVPGLRALNDACLGPGSLDDAQRERCGAVGRMLVERGQNMLELGLGMRLGERAGWPEDELRALRERRDAYHRVTSEHQRYWTCEYQRHGDQYIAAALDGSGELKFAQKLVEASDRSPAELARQWRERSIAPLR